MPEVPTDISDTDKKFYESLGERDKWWIDALSSIGLSVDPFAGLEQLTVQPPAGHVLNDMGKVVPI